MLKPVRILHIFGRMNRGGAEMRTLDIMRQLDPKQYELHFCALTGLPGELDDEIRSLGGEVHLVPLGVGFPWRFRRLLREQKFQAVHSHVHLFSGFILKLAKQCRVGTRITHFRSTDDAHSDGLRRQLQRKLMRRWTDQYSTHILAVGEGAMESAWEKCWREDARCQVIYNGIDAASFAQSPDREGVRQEFGWPADCPLYIHVGRFYEKKNHQKVLQVFRLIQQSQPAARLLFVGGGGNEVETTVRAYIDQNSMHEQIALAGVRGDVARLFRASDLMIFPSLLEGSPGAIIEACAAGVPVMASDIPTIRETAAYFPFVRCLPATETDEVWARATLDLYEVGTTPEAREAAEEAFAQSVFSLTECVRRNCAVWREGV